MSDTSFLKFRFPLLKYSEEAGPPEPDETAPADVRPSSGTKDEESASGENSIPPLPGRVILLGIDSADWQVIDPMIAEGRLEHFARLKSEGAWGELQSIRPMLSPPIWTTIITGKNRDKHGIGDFQKTDLKTRKQFFQAFSFDRKCPALWNILSSRGLSSAIVNWWATWPAEEIKGRIVSNHFVLSYVSRGKIEEGLTFPGPLFDEIRGLAVNLEDEAEKKKMVEDHPALARAEKHYRNDETVTRITLYLLEKYEPAFCAAYLWELDHLKHIRWLKDMAEPDELIKHYYAYMDQTLARFMARVDRRTALVVVSDHGFSRARHREKGIIALYGAGIEPGICIKDAVVRDVTPTILALLGQPVGKDMDGRILADGFSPELLNHRPLRFIDSYDAIFKPVQPVENQNITRDLHDKLKSMGYIQ